jgi:CRP-like cAMP-binding protein
MRRAQQWPYSLSELELFSECSRSELRRIGSLLTSLRVEPGRVLMSEDWPGSELLVITEGTAEVSPSVAEPHAVGSLGPGSVAGRVAVGEAIPSHATVRAVTPVEMLVSSRREFDTLIAHVPAVADRVAERARRRPELRSDDEQREPQAA